MLSPELLTAPAPKILWIELTSKCPFDCIFCSRKLRRGNGEHMRLELFRRILAQLDHPEMIRLNYSGESIHYPHLAEAVQGAKATGAVVELVSAFSSASETAIRALAGCGLDRLTISIHTMDEEQYRRIYRFSSLAELKAKLRFLRACQETGGRPRPELVIAFVAMNDNLDQLAPVVAFAREIGASGVSIHPVIRRDPILVQFPAELDASGQVRSEFGDRLANAVKHVSAALPEVRISIARPDQASDAVCREPGVAVATCEQNPWETMHILANGDVVACEVQDKTVFGNLGRQSLNEVWLGRAYRTFRTRYQAGVVPACVDCPWAKRVAQNRWAGALAAAAGGSPQFVRGWYEPDQEPVVWSRKNSVLVLKRSASAQSVRVHGMLPPGPRGSINRLSVCCDGDAIGEVRNATPEVISFDALWPLSSGGREDVVVEFLTDGRFSPSRESRGSDTRELGFALIQAELKSEDTSERTQDRFERRAARLTFGILRRIDQLGQRLEGRLRLPLLPPPKQCFRPGLSIVIPERGNVSILDECLASLERALVHVAEPAETVVVVNGSRRAEYAGLQSRYPSVRFRFHVRSLGFSRAVHQGLRHVVHDWVYLLNSDMVLEEGTLAEVLRYREPDIFSIGSQIFLRDQHVRRVETNWNGMALHDGLVEIWDAEPDREAGQLESAYSGGGSSLFQTRLLRRLAGRTFAYDPFYWEDAEWGAVARRHYYRNVFCPASRVWHRRRATVGRYYPPSEVDRIFERNRWLFQLRNVRTPGGLEALQQRLVSEDARTNHELLSSARVLTTLWQRWRGVLYPAPEDVLFETQPGAETSSEQPICISS